jgi:hypothetical protein
MQNALPVPVDQTRAMRFLTALTLFPEAAAISSTDRPRSICSTSESCFFVGALIILFVEQLKARRI